MAFKPVIIVFVSLLVIAAQAAEKEVVESIRADFLERAKQSALPEDLKQEYVSLIQDDTKPLDGAVIAAVFNNQEHTPHQNIRRGSYIIALLFRYRDDPGKIVEVFDHLTPAEQVDVLGLLSVPFKPFVNRDYLPLTEKGLLATIQLAQSTEDRKVQGHWQEMAYSWVELAARTRNPSFGSTMLHVLKTRILDPNFRFNTVSIASSKGGEQALDIVQWYYETYCFRPFEVEVLERYMLGFMDEPRAHALIDAKRALLAEAGRAVERGMTPATRPSKGSINAGRAVPDSAANSDRQGSHK